MMTHNPYNSTATDKSNITCPLSSPDHHLSPCWRILIISPLRMVRWLSLEPFQLNIALAIAITARAREGGTSEGLCKFDECAGSQRLHTFPFPVIFRDTIDCSHLLYDLEVALWYPAFLSVKFHHQPSRRRVWRGCSHDNIPLVHS